MSPAARLSRGHYGAISTADARHLTVSPAIHPNAIDYSAAEATRELFDGGAPLAAQRVVSLPPALSVFGVIAGGMLFGPIGLIFASPLLVVALVLVKRLWVEEVLHTPTHVPGRDPE